ncbi:DUF397 domain-containing protein [Actinomadura scrupuli]|uniref:DUF397 domain-containing protein n=1 Tax=Actinomadura scrupuli TaxID=559629 RepID=UPI003D98BA11
MTQDLSPALWRRSSRSGPEGGDCVEVAVSGRAEPLISVRDSKNPDGVVLTFAPAEWTGLVRRIKADRLTG